MQSRLTWSLAVALAGFITLAVSGQDILPVRIQPIQVQPIEISGVTRPDPPDPGPVNLIGVMAVPGGFASSDILWVDQASGRLFLTDRTNKAIDIFDAVNDVFVTRVTGFVGAAGPGVTNGAGPNGVLVTPDNILWAGDGNSTLQAVD